MVLLNKIKEMKQKGASDEEIIRSLRQEGVPPKEINNALSQSKIKAAVNGEVYSETQNMQPSLSPQQIQEGAYPLPQEPQEQTKYPQEQYQEVQEPQEQTQEVQEPQEQTQEVQEQQEQAPATTMEEQAFPQAYPQYEQYEPMPQAISGDIVSEIAEQIAEEKVSQIKKQIERLQDIEGNIGLRVVDMEKRMERIESIIDNLQNSFIKKIGIYGQGIEDIKTEMQGMQETFSKMVNPLLDNIKKTEINSGKTRRRI